MGCSRTRKEQNEKSQTCQLYSPSSSSWSSSESLLLALLPRVLNFFFLARARFRASNIYLGNICRNFYCMIFQRYPMRAWNLTPNLVLGVVSGERSFFHGNIWNGTKRTILQKVWTRPALLTLFSLRWVEWKTCLFYFKIFKLHQVEIRSKFDHWIISKLALALVLFFFLVTWRDFKEIFL